MCSSDLGFLAPGIDWRAHFGGLVVGAAVAAILVHAPVSRRVVIQIVGVGGIIVIVLAVAAARTSQIQESLSALSIAG